MESPVWPPQSFKGFCALPHYDALLDTTNTVIKNLPSVPLSLQVYIDHVRILHSIEDSKTKVVDNAAPFPFLFRSTQTFTGFSGIATDNLAIARAYAIGALATYYWNECIRHDIGTQGMVMPFSKCFKLLHVIVGMNIQLPDNKKMLPPILTNTMYFLAHAISELCLYCVKPKPPADCTEAQLLEVLSILNHVETLLQKAASTTYPVQSQWLGAITKWVSARYKFLAATYLFKYSKLPFTVKVLDSCTETASVLREVKTILDTSGMTKTKLYLDVEAKLQSGYQWEQHKPLNYASTIRGTAELLRHTLHEPLAQKIKLEEATLTDVIPGYTTLDLS